MAKFENGKVAICDGKSGMYVFETNDIKYIVPVFFGLFYSIKLGYFHNDKKLTVSKKLGLQFIEALKSAKMIEEQK